MSNTSVAAKPFTFTAGQTILSSQVNSDFDTIYTELANIGTANILDASLSTAKYIDASVTLAKLAAAVQAALNPTGAVQDYIGTTAPSGWVLADGKTIGNASSGGTERANADTSDLFTLLWNSCADAEAPVSSGRGASAAADFAANKTITLPDLRGRVVAGKDNMGGTTASRITASGGNSQNFDGTVNARAGGSQQHTLVFGEIPAHTHGVTDAGHTHATSGTGHAHGYQLFNTNLAVGGGAATVQSASTGTVNTDTATPTITATNSVTGLTVNSTGGASSPGGLTHTVLQATMVLTKIIKL